MRTHPLKHHLGFTARPATQRIGSVPVVTMSSTLTGATGNTVRGRTDRESPSEAGKKRMVFTHMSTNAEESLKRCAKMLAETRLSYQQWCSFLQSVCDVSGQNLAGSLETAVKAVAGDQFESVGAREMKPAHTKTTESMFDKIQTSNVTISILWGI